MGLGILGIGSFPKPDSIGEVVTELFRRLTENASKEQQSTSKSKKEITVVQNIGKVEGGMVNQIGSENSEASIDEKEMPNKKKGSSKKGKT